MTKFEDGEEKALVLHPSRQRKSIQRLLCHGQWCPLSCDEVLPGSKAPLPGKTGEGGRWLVCSPVFFELAGLRDWASFLPRGQALVGRWIQCFWDGEGCWYEAKV